MDIYPEKTEERIISTAISVGDAGKRLDVFLSTRFTYHSRHQWQEIIRTGKILLNGKPAKNSTKLKIGDILDFIPETDEPETDNTYNIVFEDEHIIAVSKSGNLPCHPAGPFFKNTLWHLLAYGRSDPFKPYFLSRLDRETSGIVLIAKSAETAAKFAEKELLRNKRYLAVVFGLFPEKLDAAGYLYIDDSIHHGHTSKVRKKRYFSYEKPGFSSENCHTVFTLERKLLYSRENGKKELSLVMAELHTGRTHQIRATLCSLGFPLPGDKLYGPDESVFIRFINDEVTDEDRERLLMPRQALHASSVTFIHPATDREITLNSPLPGDMADLCCGK